MQLKAEAPDKEPLSLEGPSVALSGVARRYRSRRREVSALEGVDLELREREIVAGGGPSGCGKSTLLELGAGLPGPDDGGGGVSGRGGPAARPAARSYMPPRALVPPPRHAPRD